MTILVNDFFFAVPTALLGEGIPLLGSDGIPLLGNDVAGRPTK